MQDMTNMRNNLTELLDAVQRRLEMERELLEQMVLEAMNQHQQLGDEEIIDQGKRVEALLDQQTRLVQSIAEEDTEPHGE